jgi:Domain of unknown function (DUF2715)
MTRTRISLLTVATALGAALPAFAQAPAPAPAPMYAPAQAPMMAPAPAPETAVMPAAPMMAPKASDDMTGSVGFGVGVGAGTSLVVPDTSKLAMKYWMSDAMALIPSLSLQMQKVKDTDMAWKFAPAVLADFTLLKGASTRLSVGAGLGLTLAKGLSPAVTTVTDTYFAIAVPVQIGVEHFFTRWFSMGLGAKFDFLSYSKQGDIPWHFDVEVSNINYMGSLFFYTD